jgi:hypothetical protein
MAPFLNQNRHPELEETIAELITQKYAAPEGSAEYLLAMRALASLRYSYEMAGPITEDLLVLVADKQLDDGRALFGLEIRIVQKLKVMVDVRAADEVGHDIPHLQTGVKRVRLSNLLRCTLQHAATSDVSRILYLVATTRLAGAG